jgi:parvulin-like peptidyl-prolyl isomerase
MKALSLAHLLVGLLVAGTLVLALALTGCSKQEAGDTSKDAKQVAKAGTSEAAKPAESEATPAPKYVQPLPPGNIRASHILISYAGAPATNATRSKAEAKKLADELVVKVANGEDFAALAGTYSDCPSREAGGDLGFFPKGRMVQPFENAAFALRPGQVSKIVETQFGYHIIKRTQ